MKTITLTAILYTFALFLFPSCSKDWFDLKSNKNQTIPTTLEDLELLMDDYQTISSNTSALVELSADGHHVLESAWPTYLVDNPEYNSSTNAYTWSFNRPFIEVADWNLAFKKIFICNLVLHNIEKLSRNPENGNQYDRIKGNALFIKAKTYLELAQLYAEPYTSGRNSKYGLPLKEGVDITEKISRSSVGETYDMIETAIKTALSLLPNRAAIPTRASKNSCHSLLSRFYLITGNYQQCVKHADSALKINSSLMDFNNLPIGPSSIGLFNPEVTFHSVMSNYAMLSLSSSYVDSSLYNLYEENDLRKVIFYRKTDSGYVFVGNYANDANKFSGLANDEILLNRAEAYARLNQLKQALADMHTLLKTRFKIDDNGNSTYKPPFLAGQEAVLKTIISERRKELIYRGIRWSDIRRLRQEPLYAVKLERTIGETTYKLNNIFQYTLLIPEDEISFSAIIQNPGWNN